jgi:hypothetical protein
MAAKSEDTQKKFKAAQEEIRFFKKEIETKLVSIALKMEEHDKEINRIFKENLPKLEVERKKLIAVQEEILQLKGKNETIKKVILFSFNISSVTALSEHAKI